ncbi:MAG: ATP-binding cassette domain-containing protein [Alphaproteobacteria bacterium]|nr:ATP-binding cassette domain-containing protein [Alphaproteobacteria bacterium]
MDEATALTADETAPATPAPVLEARDVALVYRTRTGTIAALHDLSLTVGDGEFVAMLGPSGCGKSSFLKIAAGLIPLSSGRVLLNGTPTERPRPDVGMVFQQPALMPWKTVLENVLITARCLGHDIATARAVATRLLELVGLGAFAGNYPFELFKLEASARFNRLIRDFIARHGA